MRKLFGGIIGVILVTIMLYPINTDCAKGAYYPVWLRGQPVVSVTENDVINKDGRLYMPLRPVIEAMGHNITWHGDHANITDKLVRPEISNNGDTKFTADVNKALDLLQEKDHPTYVRICENATRIVLYDLANDTEGNYPDNADAATSNRVIIIYTGFYYERSTVEYLAEVLSHEAVHAEYDKYFGDSRSGIYREEKIAYNYGLITLDLIDAPQWIKTEVETAREQHLSQLTAD